MTFNTPQLVEINSELKQFEYYFDGELNSKLLNAEISVKTSIQRDTTLVFFIHVRFKYNIKDESKTIFHADYIITFNLEKIETENKKSISLNKEKVGHLLGMSILMTRGAMAMRLRGNIIQNFPLPILKPLELLSENLEEDDENYIIPIK